MRSDSSIRLWLPAALLALGTVALATSKRQVEMPLAKPIQQALPDSLFGLSGSDLEVAKAEREVSGVDDYAFRVFSDDSTGIGVSIYVGYYTAQTQGKTIHSPKNCLPGAGWEPVSSGTVTIDAGGYRFPANRYVLENRGHQALVYYWYQGRGRISANEYLVKWEQIRDRALSGRSDEALVRVLVPVQRGKSIESADSLALEASRRIVRPLFTSFPAFPSRPAPSATSGS